MMTREGQAERIQTTRFAVVFHFITALVCISAYLWLVFTGRSQPISSSLCLVVVGILSLATGTFFYSEYREEKQDAKALDEEEQQQSTAPR